MKLELDYALELLRESAPAYHGTAIGMVRSAVNAGDSPFTTLRNVETALAALDTVLAERKRRPTGD